MARLRILVSSVQSEFARERAALRDYLNSDPLMRRFFDVLVFKDARARERRPDELDLDELEQCDLYVGLFGDDYGNGDEQGRSPTEREFDRAGEVNAHRLILVKGSDDRNRHPKMRALIGKAQPGLIRKRFNTIEELVAGVYAALVEYMHSKELIRSGPFDAATCSNAAVTDLDMDRIAQFVRTARRAGGLPLPEGANPNELLEHLKLVNNERPTNAAVLLFGKSPQRFLISSEIKCAYFHGTGAHKPIPSYQVYKGTVFDLVDQAVDFVLSKIALSVGTRAKSAQAPVRYEIPMAVIEEAIVNAVAHRDYTSNGSVQVMLFSDRLEVRNPARLPSPLPPEKLREPHASIPGNPLLAESLCLAKYIERMGTGTLDMIRRCIDASLPEPEFSDTGEFVTTVWRACVVKVLCAGSPVAGVDVQAISTEGTGARSTTDERGEARIDSNARALPLTMFASAEGFAACVERDWIPAEGPFSLELKRSAHGGSVILHEGTGRLPGLNGILNPVKDAHDRIRLYASNITINDGQPQPVRFALGEEFDVVDTDGNELVARIVDVAGRSALVEYRASAGQTKRTREPRPEWLEAIVLDQLARKPMSKAELMKELDPNAVSLRLQQAVQLLLAGGLIEYTLPDRPRSRLQKYRLAPKGRNALNNLERQAS